MSKQIYIDSNGNEVQVSGTVNTADMMPMSGNDSTKVSEAIGSLSSLTTTDKSSLVGAVNSINRIDTKSITISITCRGYIRCYQMGKIVFVDININTDGNTTPVNTTIATGFPKPYESFYPRLLARDNNGTYAQVLNFDKNNGTIKTADTVMQGNTWWGCQFTYFTND